MCQEVEGEIHPIAYFSKKLSDTQKNYSISELEAFAVLQSLKRFDNIVLGRPIRIETDHAALIHIAKGTTPPNPRLARWKLALERYSFTIAYKRGVDHCNADALSRPDGL